MSYNVVLENKSLDDLIDIIYPVGSVYISVTSTNPKVLFGGEWTQIKDTFLLACGNSYANGATGGEANHTLTVNEMPEHEGHHPLTVAGGTNGYYLGNDKLTQYGSTGRGWSIIAGNEAHPYVKNIGGSQPHNNMPPYLAVYMWKRIS